MKTVRLYFPKPNSYLQPEIHQGKICNVIKRELNDKIYCYYLKFPFFLQYPKYCCHENWFSVLDERFIERIPVDLLLESQLIVMGKNVIVCFSSCININF